MSHSKRNTTRPVFTSYEREQAKSNWSSSSAQLSRDSFLPFGFCSLCLENAREPVACPRGDIFCRECALANLLAQKKELKRSEKARQNADKEAARIRAIGDEEERERAIRDFEMTQAGFSNSSTNKQSSNAVAESEKEEAVVRAGSKRKFALDADELDRIAESDKTRARKAIEDEKAAKPSLPSFWTPSLTPDVKNSGLPPVTKKAKTTPTCPASAERDPHPLSLQKLLTIQFNETTDSSTKDTIRTCPSCLKTLSNASSPVMAEKCGHVLCLNCVKKFLLPSEKKQAQEADSHIACFVCSTPVAVTTQPTKVSSSKGSLPVGLIKLKSEGTGFSARGSRTVEKTSVAFQC
ncbi:zinc finger containing [Trichoderma arundinaceum]|uniref:Zinc finger containing n=1 Tax=Trichoderma arundinaceum TaxID=490622 RepID=A0A395NE53_TRIAR|nr:zinc finger containing [Trichoderma arundinaceum]